MRRIAVESSVIRSVGYRAAGGVLEVEFTDGDIYRYQGVPRGQYDQLLAANSHGEFFNREIKPIGYHFTKVGESSATPRR